MGLKINRILIQIFFTYILFASFSFDLLAQKSIVAPTNRKEREYIKEGNGLYKAKRYADAEVQYRKAVDANHNSEIGTYNLALSLLNQGNPNKDKKSSNNPVAEGDSLLHELVRISKNIPLVSRAYYNMGNNAYHSEQYDVAIEMYKNCLRRNPNDLQAIQNLRLAQKKQQQNKDKKDQDKDKNKDKDKDKDNDKDKNKDQKQDQNKKNDQNDDQQQSPSRQQQDNSEQILNAVQQNESATQQKINMKKAKEQERRSTKNKW